MGIPELRNHENIIHQILGYFEKGSPTDFNHVTTIEAITDVIIILVGINIKIAIQNA